MESISGFAARIGVEGEAELADIAGTVAKT
jgi:hypothetical protein